MPQASTLEFLRKLQDLCEEYAQWCTPIELTGALHWAEHDVREATQSLPDEEDEEDDDE